MTFVVVGEWHGNRLPIDFLGEFGHPAADIPSGGDDVSPLANDGILPADQYAWQITSLPGSGTLTATDAGAVSVTGVSGSTTAGYTVYILRGATGTVDTQANTISFSDGSGLAVGTASEADISIARQPVQLRTAGLSSEADTSLALSVGGSLAVGAAVETDTAVARPCVQARPTAMAAETDTSFALVVAQAKAAGMAIEVDTAFARAAVLSRSAGLAAETDYAMVPGAMVWPDPSDVLFGVTYGPTGVEYTGTLRPISKGVKIDIATGRAVLVLNNRIVRTI